MMLFILKLLVIGQLLVLLVVQQELMPQQCVQQFAVQKLLGIWMPQTFQ